MAKNKNDKEKISIYEYEDKYASKADQKKAKGFFTLIVLTIGVLVFACAFSLFKDVYDVNKYAGYAVGAAQTADGLLAAHCGAFKRFFGDAMAESAGRFAERRGGGKTRRKNGGNFACIVVRAVVYCPRKRWEYDHAGNAKKSVAPRTYSVARGRCNGAFMVLFGLLVLL